MLLRFIPLLRCPVCRDDEATLELTPIDDPDGADRVRAGFFSCRSCGKAFIIDDDTAYLVTDSLMYPDVVVSFTDKYRVILKDDRFAGLLSRATSAGQSYNGTPDGDEQLKQRHHYDYHGLDYAGQPFWDAVDSLAFPNFHRWMPANATILDLGCGDGRSSFQILRPGDFLLGLDLSRSLILRAIERASRTGVGSRASFIVADVTAPPIRSATFDCALTFGVLHHVPSPVEVCAEIQRILKAGGIHFGLENNASAFRKLFDLLMKAMPLWQEEAGHSPTMTMQEVGGWVSQSNGRLLDGYTTVFLPPHLLNLFSPSAAKAMIAWSDKLCGMLGLRRQGGLLIFAAVKRAPGVAIEARFA